YDAAWNLSARTNNGVAGAFSSDSRNQLTAAPSSSTFTYDGNGNMTYYGASGGWQRNFAYDDENQLASITIPGYYYSTFTYDGLGRLRKRLDHTWVLNATKHYIYD